jgi:hypothetical protein
MFEDNGRIAEELQLGSIQPNTLLQLPKIVKVEVGIEDGSSRSKEQNLPRKLNVQIVTIVAYSRTEQEVRDGTLQVDSVQTFDVPALAQVENPTPVGDPNEPDPSQPQPVSKALTIEINTTVVRAIPNSMVSLLGFALSRAGWELNTFVPIGNGYQITLTPTGTFAIIPLIGVIAAWLAKIGIGVLGWKILDVAGNVIENKEKALEIDAEKVSLAESILNDDSLSESQKEQFFRSLFDNNGGGTDIGTGLAIGGTALAAGLLLLALSRK